MFLCVLSSRVLVVLPWVGSWCIFQFRVVCLRCFAIAAICTHVCIFGCPYCFCSFALGGFLVCMYRFGFCIVLILVNWNCPILFLAVLTFFLRSAYVSVDLMIAFRNVVLFYVYGGVLEYVPSQSPMLV